MGPLVAAARAGWGSPAAAYAASAASLVPGAAPGSRFVVTCLPRTGSELLVRLLDSVPGVRCEGEILEAPPRYPLRFLEGRAVQGRARGARAWGCKILGQQVMWYPERYGDGAAFYGALAARGWRIVRLVRRATLASTLSALDVRDTGRSHHRAGDGAAAAPRAYDTADVIAWLHALDHQQRWLDEALAGVAHERVVYEEDLFDAAAQQRTVDRLCTLLGVPSAPVSAPIVRVAPAEPLARAANADELVAALRLTRFADLVDG